MRFIESFNQLSEGKLLFLFLPGKYLPMLPSINPIETRSWQKLTAHFLSMQAIPMRELFAEDPERFKKFSLLFEDILFDYSKNIVLNETLDALIELANECELSQAIHSMFHGDRINQTENRS